MNWESLMGTGLILLVFVAIATAVNLLGITATARFNKLLLALQLLLLAVFAALCSLRRESL